MQVMKKSYIAMKMHVLTMQVTDNASNKDASNENASNKELGIMYRK